MRYKPLLLHAAANKRVEGDEIAFSRGPLLEYYRQFCEAVDVDGSRPKYPYYHLTGDGFWRIWIAKDASQEELVSPGTSSPSGLRGSRVRLDPERVQSTEHHSARNRRNPLSKMLT